MTTLLATDRCDRCGAQAILSCDSLDWVSTLLFCGHHYREHSVALGLLGVVVIGSDDRTGVTQ